MEAVLEQNSYSSAELKLEKIKELVAHYGTNN